MANIRKVGNAYKITVSLGRDQNGNQIRKYLTYTPKEKAPSKIQKEVQAAAVDFEQRVKNGKYYDGDSMSFRQFVSVWKRDFAKDNLTPGILEGYEKTLENKVYPEIGNLKIAKIRAPHIQDIYRKMKEAGNSPSTIRRTHAILSGIFKRAYMWEIIGENPCGRVSLPKSEDREGVAHFDVQQTEAFLRALTLPYTHTVKAHASRSRKGTAKTIREHSETNYIHPQFVVYFNLAIFSGCRRGELLALNWSDIDFENHIISINKATAKAGGKQVIKAPKTKAGYRDLNLPPSCFHLLHKWKLEQMELAVKLGDYWRGERGKDFDKNFIFIQDNGLQMDLGTPTHKFKEIIAAYNEQHAGDDKLPEIRLHDLRHTNATLLISQNTDIKTVSARLGHSKPSVTLDIYTHALRENDEKASQSLEALLTKAQ